MHDIHTRVEFEWDDTKDEANRAKHGVSFEQAKGVFADARALVFDDSPHSNPKEKRHRIIGKNSDGLILTVVFTHRGNSVRIISAQVRRKDVKFYEAQESKS